jgi:uncharacterized protein YggE
MQPTSRRSTLHKALAASVLLCLSLLTACVQQTPSALVAPSSRLVTVTGDAEVRVVPDEVIITFGIETVDRELAVAKTKNDERLKALLAFAASQGIEPKYIQTDQISIEPRYRDSYEQRDFIGYFVRKSVVITLKDISKFETLLSGALEGGVNYVQGASTATRRGLWRSRLRAKRRWRWPAIWGKRWAAR